MDGYDLTLEEVRMLMSITHARIKTIEEKAIKRLNMTEEERAAQKLFVRIMKDPELKDLFITSFILGNNDDTKRKTDNEEQKNS